MSRPAEVALLSSPGSPPGLILRAEETSDRLRSRRGAARRGASPPPPPISRRTSLTLSSFSAATLTTPLLPMTSLPTTTEFAATAPNLAAATMPSNVAAWPPRRTSARLAALAAASAASAATVTAPLPSSDRKRPAARRRRTPPIKRCKTSQEDLIALAEDDSKMAAHPPSSPEAEAVCCICLSSLHDDTARLPDCPHEFCTPCILQWSRTENSCPLCKQRFTQILSKTPSKQRVRRIAVPHRNQRSETGRVLDSILQSLQQHAGGNGTGAVGRIHIGMTAIGNGPWMLTTTAGTGGDGELEDFLRRFFVTTTTGHSADTAIEIPDAAQETVELE